MKTYFDAFFKEGNESQNIFTNKSLNFVEVSKTGVTWSIFSLSENTSEENPSLVKYDV